MVSLFGNDPQSPFIRPLLAAGVGFGILALLALGLAMFGDVSGVEVGSRHTLSFDIAAADQGDDSHDEESHDAVEFHGEDHAEPTLPGVHELASETQPALPPARSDTRNAPYPGLSEPGPGGPLPIISANGERSSHAYAHPFEGDEGRPTVGIIIGGLGLNRSFTEAAIDELPPEVTLSFVPYVDNLQDWIDRARAAGHEVVLELPMEPFDYPNNDPGPHTLRAGADPLDNKQRLDWLLSRAAGYFGVTNYLGARLSSDIDAVRAVFAELERRGLAVLHDGSGRRNNLTRAGEEAGAMLAIADRVLDSNPSPEAIDQRLLELEALALQNGTAYGSGFAYPATVNAVKAWIQGLELGGYQLAPVSYIMEQRNPNHSTASAPQGEHASSDDPSSDAHGTDDHAPAQDDHGDDHH